MGMTLACAEALVRKADMPSRTGATSTPGASTSAPAEVLTFGDTARGRQTRAALDAMARTHRLVQRQPLLRRLL